jgi:hypothetical protein
VADVPLPLGRSGLARLLTAVALLASALSWLACAGAAAETTEFEICTVAAQCQYGSRGTLGGELDYWVTSIAADSEGHVYVTDRENQRIEEFTTSGNFIRAWGKDVVSGGGTGAEICTVAVECKAGVRGYLGGELSLPEGIATDGSGHVFVAGSFRIDEFDSSGDFIRAWGKDVMAGGGEMCTVAAQCTATESGYKGGQFISSGRMDVAATSAGTVYVSEYNRIQKFDSSGNFLLAFGNDVLNDKPGLDPGFEICAQASECRSGAEGYLSSYLHVAADDLGHVYVSDEARGTLTEFDSSGKFLRVWGRDVIAGGPDGPELCSVEAECSFYTGNGGLGGEFGEPGGLDRAPGGGVYVADGGWNGFLSQRIQQFDSSGNFLRAWGKDVVSSGGTGHELCLLASQCLPGITGGLGGELVQDFDVTVEANGDSYVAENSRVQKFDQGGEFLRIWGKDVVRPDSPASEAEPPVPPDEGKNRAPIARPDEWTLDAGLTLEENALANDYDPDGDPISAKVIQISFAHKEWSGMEPDGTFLYTAGPGTSSVLRKRITYVAIDSHGAESKPATAAVTIVPGKHSASPLKPKRRRARLATTSSAAPYWQGPFTWAQICFHSGLKLSCYLMQSVATARALDNDTSWVPDLPTAGRWCLKYGILPLGATACAAKLREKGLFYLWDKSVIHNAAKFGDCLLSRIGRHRTVSHPLSGDWAKPEYHTDDSLVTPFDNDTTYTGFGKWWKGSIFSSAKWRVPLFCDAYGRVYRQINQVLTTAP